MFSRKVVFILSSFLMLSSVSFLRAEDKKQVITEEVKLENVELLENAIALERELPSCEVVNSWKPYWLLLKQPKSSPFFQTNIGIGFLYFSHVRGNLSVLPPVIANFSGSNAPLEGKLNYNRTPLYEFLLGERVNSWFKFALSYQFQGGITMQTTPRSNFALNSTVPARAIVTIFKANLSLNALMAKFYYEHPIPMIWKMIAYSPYVGIGVGPGWQSWTALQVTRIQTGSFATTSQIVEQSLRQKTCANPVWMLDLGLRVRSVSIDRDFFFVLGVKYNQWGQARNLGKMTQQGSNKIAFMEPFKIRTLFSFAPYLGAQFDFPNTYASKSPPQLAGHSLKSWKPFLVDAECLGDIKTVFTEFNVGVGCLYFRKVRGSLSSRVRDPLNNLASNVPFRPTGESYNRTPLLEVITGFRLKPWLKVAASYQHQSDIAFSTKTQYYTNLNTGLGLQNSDTYAQFKAELILDGVLGKGYLEFPNPMVWRGLAYSPYLALGFGIGWQTWTQMNVWRYTNLPVNTLTSAAQPLRTKICGNAIWMADLGIRLKSAYPNVHFSVLMGCKYNQWGQARNLGKMSQQLYRSYGLFPVMKIKTIYSFAPYLGVAWDFSIYNKFSTQIKIKNKSPNTWIPYLASICEVQAKTSIWSEYSLGAGFLYFHKIGGQLAPIPAANGYTNIPAMNRTLSYNRTPLYEYLLGYRLNSWLKTSISYQTQRNISISTQVFKPSLASQINNGAMLTANLQLDSFMAKVYFESPLAVIFKNLATTPYLAVATGPAWQSWTQINYCLLSNGGRKAQYYTEKICASMSLMVDAGFRVQSVSSKGHFSITKGIKYIQWGQARNIGELSQQGPLKTGLFKPLKVKVIYSFVPYIGVQWNF